MSSGNVCYLAHFFIGSKQILKNLYVESFLVHCVFCTFFVAMRHNNLKDFEADMLFKIVNDVGTEPELQPVTVEIIEGLSGNASRPDIRARAVWRAGQSAFYDVRVTNTHSPSQIHLTTESALKKHEQEKKRNYNRRIMNIEHGTFTPLVFFCFWGYG